MARKKKETGANEEASKNEMSAKTEAKTAKAETKAADTQEKQETAKAERRPPQMVTANGDRVTHGHVFKSNNSDDWFFTAKINDVPLKPQKVTKEDMEGVINKTKTVEEMMRTYYPTKLMPKVSADDMRLPASIMTPEGEKRIYKFNAYKEHDPMNVDYGKYRFYAQVDGLKMSTSASKADLNAYFDKVMKPAEMVTKLFGDRLNMAEHYRMFQLPEGSGIEPKQIHIMKNPQTNRFEISVNMGQLGRTPAKELAFNPDGTVNMSSQIGNCPKCGGILYVGPKAVSCSNFRHPENPCNFTIWRNTCGHDLTLGEIVQIVTAGATTEAVDCHDNRGNRSMHRIGLNAEKEVVRL